MSVAVLFIILLFKKCKAQCLPDTGSCKSNTVIASWLIDAWTTPPYTFIQTFDVSSCVSDKQLEISQISIWYEYYVTNAVSLDFKLEFFIPSSLTAFSRTDVDNKIATAQISTSLTNTWSSTKRQIIFSNLNIKLGCNPHFAMFLSHLNCEGDPLCYSTPSLRELSLHVCSVPNQQETLFVYNNAGNVPPELTSIDIMSPETSSVNYKMDVDIAYHNTSACMPTIMPTEKPTKTPTKTPTQIPTIMPTKTPTKIPTSVPTPNPSRVPTLQPAPQPTLSPTEFEPGFARTAPVKENRNTATAVDSIIVIASLVAALSIVYCIYKYYSTKDMTKQVIDAVMEASGGVVVLDDIVNCNIQDTDKKTGVGTDEHLEGIVEPITDEGVQAGGTVQEICNPKLVMMGSVKVTIGQPEATAPIKKSEDDDSSTSEDLWDGVSQTNRPTDGFNCVDDVISDNNECRNNAAEKEGCVV